MSRASRDQPLRLRTALHHDERGFFRESYRLSELMEAGIYHEWVQTNHSRSRRGVIRGLHFQPGQAKLVQCVRGRIYDAVVDVRPGSATFGEWEAHQLDDEAGDVLYVPSGFAHGFCVTSDVADVMYACSDYYDADREQRIAPFDADIGITWPELPAGSGYALSGQDRTAPTLR